MHLSLSQQLATLSIPATHLQGGEGGSGVLVGRSTHMGQRDRQPCLHLPHTTLCTHHADSLHCCTSEWCWRQHKRCMQHTHVHLLFGCICLL
jgi:hypothetical protein